jgi:predicted AAA+ superfamily ATPase
MRNSPFQVTSPPIASMRGRAREKEKLLSHLQKEVPDNVSVIGPRFIGKTVLLNAVGSYFT